MSGPRNSPETRAKISKANKGRLLGRKLSEETRARMSAARRVMWQKRKADKEFMKQWCLKQSRAHKGKYLGEASSNWRGGVNQNERTDNRKFEWRENILVRDNYTCQVCLERGVFLHVDHIQPWSEFPELRFEASNGRAPCRPCHYYVTFKRKMPSGSRWGLSLKQVGLKDLQ